MQINQYVVYLSALFYPCCTLFSAASLAQQAPKNIPADLQSLIKNKNQISPSLLTKYAGFVGTQYNSKTDELNYWLLPENPSELSSRPLPFSIGTLKKKQINSATFNFGYLVTPSLKAVCNPPTITANGQSLQTIGGTSASLPSSNPNTVPSASAGLKLTAFRKLANAQTANYKTCALNPTSPTNTNQISPAELAQFRQLLDFILNQKNISSTIIKPQISGATNLPTPTPSPATNSGTASPPIAIPSTVLNLPPGVKIPLPKPGTYNVTKPLFAAIAPVDGTKILLNHDPSMGIKVGSVVRIERLITPMINPKTGKADALATRTIGKAIVTELFKPGISYGRVISGTGIKQGDFGVLIQP
jgi:hypothetical protein